MDLLGAKRICNASPAETHRRTEERSVSAWRKLQVSSVEGRYAKIQAAQQHAGPESPPSNPIYRAFRAVIPSRWAQEGNDSLDEPRDNPEDVSAIDALAENATDPTRTLTYSLTASPSRQWRL